MIENPTYEQLKKHFDAATADDLKTDTAAWLEVHLQTIKPFTQSDWEFELDQMMGASEKDLLIHLMKAPDPASETAQWLRGYLSEQRLAA